MGKLTGSDPGIREACCLYMFMRGLEVDHHEVEAPRSNKWLTTRMAREVAEIGPGDHFWMGRGV